MNQAETDQEKYLLFIEDQIARLKALADRALRFYVMLRLSLVIFSAALPGLATYGAPKITTGVAILVAALAGLDTQFRWGEEWQHYRSAQVALLATKREFELRKSLTFQQFYDKAEALLQSEIERFWKFRLVEWRPQPHGQANQASPHPPGVSGG